MTEIPPPKDNIPARIYAALEAKPDKPRPHMGVSQLGHPCDRWLWLSFRWAVVEKHAGRILRLFRRGQDEEARLLEDLQAAGLTIRDEENGQHRVSFSAHVSGSMDGIIESGVPEAPAKPHVLEMKTHSAKSFSDLCKKGVERSKWQHWIQCHLYMHGTGIDRALYVAICKDDDQIYAERIRYDKELAQRYVDRGLRLSREDIMPPPISHDPSWYQCKMCPAHAFCHQGQSTQQVNCRTCAHATATETGWHCERWGADIPLEWQRVGCRSHVPHPDLVPWEMGESPDDGVSASYMIDGEWVTVGESGTDSREIIDAP